MNHINGRTSFVLPAIRVEMRFCKNGTVSLVVYIENDAFASRRQHKASDSPGRASPSELAPFASISATAKRGPSLVSGFHSWRSKALGNRRELASAENFSVEWKGGRDTQTAARRSGFRVIRKLRGIKVV